MELTSVWPNQQIEKTVNVNHPLGNGGMYTVYPQSEQDISNILQYANEQGKKVSVMSGGTKRGFGGEEENSDLLLSLAKYRGVIEHTVGDMTITVKPGTTIREIQDYLSQYNQMISLDPAWPEKATIGGVISANDSGPKRLKYGSARDHVIGLRVVYPDGKVIRTGGKVVKNVAGYDMNKLFIGAMGTLGVLSEITLKLRPTPKHESLVLLSFPLDKLEQVQPFVVNLLDSVLEPVSLELLNPSLSKNLLNINHYTLAVSFEDVKKSVEFQENWMKENCPEGIQLSIFAKEETQKIWSDFSKISPNGSKSNRKGITTEAALKIGSQNMDVVEIIKETQFLQEKNDSVIIEAHGGLGHGLSHVYLKGEKEKVLSIIHHLRESLKQKGGYVIVKHLPFDSRREISVWGEKPSYFFLLDGIKKQVDPNRILNPRRFVGGI